ncbi:PREDICTED: uncharacterized protein LOC107189165 [Dufourea novaeangliae]|uniref:Uncharacterized protein n=1 Tax=Dufourea novaeangliae TaxID=178035 RepID=A0A154PGX7_DUFNO|nr:PREDICTED: uncharacterized protein LOC107189165 [Dufourea novaeangliae]KZC11136.1 hypothetical protein WN55_02497 [Dufourea novaeangliae]
MATDPPGQSGSNMLRRMFVVLPLCGVLAICSCTIIRQGSYVGVRRQIDCRENVNSTACGAKTGEIGTGRDPVTVREARTIEGAVSGESGDGGVEEVSSRKKKGKGYGKLLMYFLGAGKLTMLYVIINTVAAIAGKALVVGKVALAIATALALKKSSEHKEKVSYEIIKHPHHTYEHTHSSSLDYDHGSFGENDFGYRKRRENYR